MISCLLIAFSLCNPNTPYGGYAYAQPAPVMYAQPQVVYAQPVYAQPVYVVQPPVYAVAQPYPFGGYGGRGISVNVGRHGGVGVRCC